MNEFNPMVSIIIPVYNGSNYMREAIDSALAQTYKNIEIIVVNDGSLDNTDEIAKSYGDKIRYFAKENGGVSTALNMGISNMRGEYFSWLSHDDLYTPDKIEKNIFAIKDGPIRIVYSDYDSIDEKGNYKGTVSAKKLHRAADYEFGLFPILNGLVHGCSLLIHKSHFEKYGLFDEELRTTQDYTLWFKMFRGQRLKYIPESLVKGRVHQRQATHTSDKIITEGEILWTGMLKSMTHEEMCDIGGSEWHFWINQASFMKKSTPYLKATAYAFEQLNKSAEALRGGIVSIITPFYNRIDFVIQCIKSVQQQSYQNWELILINDGSTDDISGIEHNIVSDKRIKLINVEHMGVAHARNVGLDTATGKFIAFLDSDDTWDSLKIEKQLKYMLDNNYCLSHTNYNRVDAKGKLLKTVDLSAMQGDMFSYFLYSCGIATPCVIAERELWGKLRFPYGIDYGEDICVWLEMVWRCEIGHLPEALTFVYISDTSASRNIYKQQLGSVEILRYILKKPEWVNFQLEIGILARYLSNLFLNNKLENSISWKIRKPLRLLRKTIMSLHHEGFRVTIKRIIRKICKKIKLF